MDHFNAILGRKGSYHVTYDGISRRIASSDSGSRMRRVHSFFIERMARSTTAMRRDTLSSYGRWIYSNLPSAEADIGIGRKAGE